MLCVSNDGEAIGGIVFIEFVATLGVMQVHQSSLCVIFVLNRFPRAFCSRGDPVCRVILEFEGFSARRAHCLQIACAVPLK